MTPEQIEQIAEKYRDASVPEVFTAKQLTIHEEDADVLGTFRLVMSKPEKGVGGRLPRWPVSILVTRPDGTDEVVNTGKANAPWNVMHEIVAESLNIMALIINEQRGMMIKARKASMKVVP
ncbi:hypothetical protein BXT89_14430 [Halopseudomonas pachastrellae]|uniref:Uncharacterized protein n=1 Tax=Halopseudomonas pachastrellae TaxID=254161 RepID=A0A1S8DCI0_9GAMM|nr:hypothetical protein [Halopseudomonas pachastrellae]ONM43145.1 hypothetical protein BXT89_14430 [Halopseudomonas pachastrellae]SFL71564.1 hypothetical protein SAMN05216256_101108 [Halopseudomonas pachastrellae]